MFSKKNKDCTILLSYNNIYLSTIIFLQNILILSLNSFFLSFISTLDLKQLLTKNAVFNNLTNAYYGIDVNFYSYIIICT